MGSGGVGLTSYVASRANRHELGTKLTSDSQPAHNTCSGALRVATSCSGFVAHAGQRRRRLRGGDERHRSRPYPWQRRCPCSGGCPLCGVSRIRQHNDDNARWSGDTPTPTALQAITNARDDFLNLARAEEHSWRLPRQNCPPRQCLAGIYFGSASGPQTPIGL